MCKIRSKTLLERRALVGQRALSDKGSRRPRVTVVESLFVTRWWSVRPGASRVVNGPGELSYLHREISLLDIVIDSGE